MMPLNSEHDQQQRIPRIITSIITDVHKEVETLSFWLNLQNTKGAMPILAEVLISFQEFSRFGQMTVEKDFESFLLAKKIHKNLKWILVWDILETDKDFHKTCEFFQKIPIHEFDGVRVLDVGVAQFIKTHCPWQKIELILEVGNHNLRGMETLIEIFPNQLKKIIFSIEIPKKDLTAMVNLLHQKSPTLELEILTFGEILLFYSPRKLLKFALKNQGGILSSESLSEDQKSDFLWALGKSEEGPHHGFPILENHHGTFMFNTKNLMLLDDLSELYAMSIFHWRIENSFLMGFRKNIFSMQFLINYSSEQHDILNPTLNTLIKEGLGGQYIKGFFQHNKSDVIFKKLKNRTFENLSGSILGEVVDVEKERQIVVEVLSSTMTIQNFLESLMSLSYLTPEGKTKSFLYFEDDKKTKFHNIFGDELLALSPGDLLVFPYRSGVILKSKLILN